MTHQGLYEAGRQEAGAYYGAETRPFDRALGGVAAILRAHGVLTLNPKDIEQHGPIAAGCLAVGSTWHNPLAGVDDSLPLERVIAWIVSVFADYVKGLSTAYETTRALEYVSYNRIDRHYMRDGYRFDLEQVLDRAIKQHDSKVRRGSKRYRELFDQGRPKAEAWIAAQRKEADARHLADLERYRAEVYATRDKALARCSNLEALAAQVAVLAPDSDTLTAAREMIAAVRARAEAYARPVDAAIAELQMEAA